MLRVENISTGYGKKQVLFDVSFEVNEGENISLTGGNGSGKSTLLKCLFNLIPLWKGETYFEGEKISGLKSSLLIRKGIVYIPQKDFYFENLTVEENLLIAGNISKKQNLWQRMEYISNQLGLHKYRKSKPFNLSGGEIKLLAFGIALINKPKFILFDEPFAGLDFNNTFIISNILNNCLKELNVGTIIIHHKNSNINFFNKNFLLENGELKLLCNAKIINLIITATLISSCAIQTKKEDVMKIGILLPLTGERGSFGQSSKSGIELAINEINFTDSLSLQIEPVYEDTKGEAKTAVSAITKLISTGYKTIIGPISSSEVLSVAPIAEKIR
ncbi:MAG: ATP-binding cassette domain-containing protein [Bacteroidales bacterium]|nr:ATP-binding cassette domain-containing protein [Bacteroidales bacterium]